MGMVGVVAVFVTIFVLGRELIVAAVVWLTSGVSGVLLVTSVHDFVHQVGCVLGGVATTLMINLGQCQGTYCVYCQKLE